MVATMSKHAINKNQSAEPIPSPEKAKPDVPYYRRCPLCWGAHGGTGKRYSGRFQPLTNSGKRYYLCGRCGHTWAVIIKPAEILSHQEHEEIEER